MTGVTLVCCECSGEMDETAAFAFRGAFACERCVRRYYRDRPSAEVALELQIRSREAIRTLKREHKNREQLAAKRIARDKKIARMADEFQELVLRCLECGAEINVSAAFDFGGAVACEKCVREYYRDRPAELESELHLRRRNAVAWVKRNRRLLERQTAHVRAVDPSSGR